MRFVSSRQFAACALVLVVFGAFASALSTMHVPAVDTNGRGIVTTIEADAKPGTGAVYIDVQPFISVETQNSARVAAQRAALAAKVNLSKYDVFFKVVADTEVVDGPSGGVALSLLAYSEFSGKKARSDLTATGTIEPEGTVGRVGGILEKVEASQNNGVRLFLLPAGQGIQNGVDLTQYAQARWGMQVVEVRNLSEAIKYAFTPAGSKVDVPARVEPPLVLTPVAALQADGVAPLRKLAETQISNNKGSLKKVPVDSVIAQMLRQSINLSTQLLQDGYYYSAANEAFISQIQSDAYVLSNSSKSDLIARILLLEREMSGYRFVQPTDTNIEWAAGSKLRYYWAQERLEEVKQKAGLAESPLPLLQDYSSAASWFEASKQLDEVAASLGGRQVLVSSWKNYAEVKLMLGNQSVTKNPLDSEAAFHLKTAKRAYGDGDYLAASYDASFAIAFSQVRGRLSKVSGSMLETLLPKPEGLKGYAGNAWAQLYYAHAIYSVKEANRSGDASYLVNAIKLDVLAGELQATLKELDARIGQEGEAPAAQKPQVAGEIQITTIQPAGVNPLLLFGSVAVIVAAVLIAFFIAYARRPAPLSLERRADLLEQGLLEGRISERTYAMLSKKYAAGKKRDGYKAVKR